jgi:nicotinamidase-related amidase
MLDIETPRTALLVMDFQNDLVDPEGAFAPQGSAAEVKEKRAIESTAGVLATARNVGLTVVHVAVAWRSGHREANRSAPLFAGVGEADALVEGSWGAEFHRDLQPAEDELVITKRGVSALAGTELDRLLRLRDVNVLVLSGFATNFVVEGTARDAVDRGYTVIVLSDCCASFTDEMHRFALDAILPQLGRVTTSEEFVSSLT